MTGDRPKCGFPTTRNGDPCQNPATGDDGYCWLDTHADDPSDAETDGRGAPEGNDNGKGHGAPEGNFNAVQTGLNMSVKRRLEWFRELGEPYLGLFEDYYVEFAAKAENKVQAAAMASAAVIRDEMEEHLLKDGVFYPKQVGDPEELAAAGKDPEDAFVDVPKGQTLEAWTDAMRELRLGLKYEGVSGNQSGGGTRYEDSTMWEDDGEHGEV